MQIGFYHYLEVSRKSEPGVYLSDSSGSEVLLPNQYVPSDLKVGDKIRVFVYKDSEDRPVATTVEPKAKLGGIAMMEVLAVNRMGAFVDWGLPKDLLVPHAEQDTKMVKGFHYLVQVNRDRKTDRLFGSTKIDQHLQQSPRDLQPGQEVDLIVWKPSKLGYQCIVDHRYIGLAYHSEIHTSLEIGQSMTGFVKEIREDGKLDVSLQPTGLKNIEAGAQRILDYLNSNDGFIPLSDKSRPERIKALLGMSKKSFKRSIGTLYRERKVEPHNEGWRLN